MSDSVEMDGVRVLRSKLMESLGDRFQQYLRLIRDWFRMKLSREELERELRKLLNVEQSRLHDQLLLRLINKCANASRHPSSPANNHYREFCIVHRFQEGFEPVDPTLYAVTERQEVHGESPPYTVHERLLPDHSVTLARLMYSAWELGLEGSQPAAAEFLTIAVQHFLKNILSAVISRKKGYKCSHNGFIHGLGTATPNPWLHNVATYRPPQFHSLKFENILKEMNTGTNGIVKPAERPTREELEHDTVFRLAASSADLHPGPISLYDLVLTLQLYPGLVASNFVRVSNTERIYARLCHPAVDD